MSKVSKRAGLIGALAIATSLVMILPASGASLPGSNFEIDTDANLVVDGAAPAIDWVSIPQGGATGQERRQPELFTGAQDESFGQGSKEDTPVPTIVDGSIPPNKSDLLTFGGYLEENAAGKFLNIYWHRVQEPSGTTNMDFEFNKSSTISGNGVTPVRTAGDVLIQYDLSQGGTNPQLFLSRWVTTGPGSQCQANNTTPCWGTRVNLSASGDAIGSINTSPISAANSDGLGAMSPRTFGEAQIDFDAFAGGSGACVNFGSAYLKSRSSDSFTAALKDFIPPLTLNFSNCGTVKVTKTDDGSPATLLDGAGFNLVKDNAPINNVGGPQAEDTVVDSCVTGELAGDTDAGICTFIEVFQGEYWIVETSAPAGYDLPTPPYQHVTVTADGTAEVTFVDPAQKGAIQITKTAKHAAAASGSIPLGGVTFTITGGNLPAAGTAVVTDAITGVACLDNLPFATDYVVTETEPTNYNAVGDGVQEVTVNNKAACADDPFVGEAISFDNVPLTDVTVSVDSLVPGGTDSEISCDTTPATTGSTSDVTGDGSVTVEDLEPTAPGVTLTCTITIDP